jgi:hypothetical protein
MISTKIIRGSQRGSLSGCVLYVAKRRGHGEDAIYFEHIGDCRDPENHRYCPGR